MTLLNHCQGIVARVSTRSLIKRSETAVPYLPILKRRNYSGGSGSTEHGFQYGYGLIGALGALVAGVGVTLHDGQISADELELSHGVYNWEHTKWNKLHDAKALRRGFLVYKNVCQACHSMQFMHWRMHVDSMMTKKEAKEFAAEYQYPCIDEAGNPATRPGELTDVMPNPYENKVKARLANNGAEPPDLSLINLAREGNEDYIFSLLMGYEPVPPGQAEPDEGQAYNPYFHGYYIGMPQQIYDEVLEYEDGTVPCASQIAKDVTEYLSWSGFPFMDEAKMYGMKAVASAAMLAMIGYYLVRRARNPVRSRQLHFIGKGEEQEITKNALKDTNWGKYKTMDKFLDNAMEKPIPPKL